MSCTYTYKNKEYSEQEILDLLKQENKSFWNRLTRTGLGLLTPETKEAILNEASKKYGIARGESETKVKYSQAQQNEINYALKAVEILNSDKAKEVFEKGKKNNWSLSKILDELQIPKEQKQLLLNLDITDREQLALELASKYSYSVEVNTGKKNLKENDLIPSKEFIKVSEKEYLNAKNNGTIGRNIGSTNYGYDGTYLFKDYFYTIIDWNRKTDESIYGKINDIKIKELSKGNSQYYSNLTVPGGTNYTENEIATPTITPSIKGHAQFATDNGIGWFRSDDRTHGGDSNLDWSAKAEANGEYDSNTNSAFTNGKDRYWIITDSEVGVPMELWDSYYKNGNKITEEEFYKAKQSSESVSNVYDGTKTRRILEVQSDWGQKQRKQSDPDMMINFNETKFLQDLQYAGDLKIECD